MASIFLLFILKTIDIPPKIEDKIFEIQYSSDESAFKIISYFPLSELERRTLVSHLNQPIFLNFILFLLIVLLMMNGIKQKIKSKNDFKMNFLILILNCSYSPLFYYDDYPRFIAGVAKW